MARIPRILRSVVARDTATFARHWKGKILVALILVLIPAGLLFASVQRGSYINDSWVAIAVLLTLVLTYVITRRLIVTVLIASLVVGLFAYGIAPRLSTMRTGDAGALAQLVTVQDRGMLASYRDLEVATIDLGVTNPIRFAGLGAGEHSRFEVGSLTKAMTGLVIEDAVARGEVKMDVPVSTYLPELDGSAAGTVTIQELVTHTAGYAPFGPATLGQGFWAAPVGLNFFDTGYSEIVDEARQGSLETRGTYLYSSLGASIAGLAISAAAHMSYPDLMRTRLFEPLGMTETAVETDTNAVDGGWSKSGLPVQPWIFGADAPSGGVVSTASDLAKLATALIDGTAPGMSAVVATTSTGEPGTSVGVFWHTSIWASGQSVTWHTGQTGGYTTYFGIDLKARRAVIVLSDISNPSISNIGIDLLTERNPK